MRLQIRPVSVAGSLLVAVPLLSSCLTDPTGIPPVLSVHEVDFAPELGIDLSQMEEWDSGIWVQDEVLGDGAEVEPTAVLLIDFQGWLPNGTLFATTLDTEPMTAVISEGALVAGFAQGLAGMRAGGRRLVLVPPHLGHGLARVPTSLTVIPPNSWLVYRIHLLEA